MIYVCTTCGRAIYREIEEPTYCTSCQYESMEPYNDFLKPKMRVRIHNRVFNGFKYIHELSLEELLDIKDEPAIETNVQLRHAVQYYLARLEYDEIAEFPEEDLPLYVNSEWHTEIGAEAYIYRLQAEGDIWYPDMEYYTARYLLKRGIKA